MTNSDGANPLPCVRKMEYVDDRTDSVWFKMSRECSVYFGSAIPCAFLEGGKSSEQAYNKDKGNG